jgi:hypothetical protein
MHAFAQKKILGADGGYALGGPKGEFDYLHAGVKEKDGRFISCADVRVGEDIYDVDSYVEKKGERQYAVVKEVLHKIKGQPAGQVLWDGGP